jgi:adenylate kinase
MNIALIGPSGAGKGTHAAALVARYGLRHVCTGDLFRDNLERQTALGLLARRYMSQGEMVPDEVVDAMIEEHLRRTPPEQGLLFDGFPRTAYQAKFLDELFDELGRRLEAVLYLSVADETVLERLAGRLICHQCRASFHAAHHPFAACPRGECQGEHLFARPDDAPELARARLRVFHRATVPVLEYYQSSGRLVLVPAEGDIAAVGLAVREAAESVRGKEILSGAACLLPRKDERAARPLPQPARPTLDLVLLGAPGSGKGTQAERLAEEFRIPHIATGDLFRDNLRKQTELGRLAKTYMDRGELVPDDVTDAMVRERLARPDAREGFLLDGYPRTLHQAQALTEMLAEMRRRPAAAIYLNVSDGEIVQRLSGRWTCRECQAPYHLQFKPPARPGVCDACGGPLFQRDDDQPATVAARLRTFHAQTEPVIEYFARAGLLVEVAGGGGLASVTERTLAAARQIVERIGGLRKFEAETPPKPRFQWVGAEI